MGTAEETKRIMYEARVGKDLCRRIIRSIEHDARQGCAVSFLELAMIDVEVQSHIVRWLMFEGYDVSGTPTTKIRVSWEA
jgi:hypothetical protein